MSSSASLAAALEAKTLQRIGVRPGDANFAWALQEVRRLKASLQPNGLLPLDVYEAQQLGLLCVRELEPVDPEYCDAVFDFLEAARPT